MTPDPTQPTPSQPGTGQPGGSFQPVAPEPGPYQVPRQAVTATGPKARSGGISLINVALGVALAIAIGGVAFAAGRLTAPTSAAANGGNGGNGGFPGRGYFGGGFAGGGYFGGGNRGGGLGAGGFGGGGASIQGTVTAVSPTSITLTTAGGQTVTVALQDTTTYHQQATATAGDVKSGSTVIVRIGFRGQGGGPTASGAPSLSASDVTVVP